MLDISIIVRQAVTDFLRLKVVALFSTILSTLYKYNETRTKPTVLFDCTELDREPVVRGESSITGCTQFVGSKTYVDRPFEPAIKAGMS